MPPAKAPLMPASSCVPAAVPSVTHSPLSPAVSMALNINKLIGFLVMRPPILCSGLQTWDQRNLRRRPTMTAE
jgi:hypothetical protein